MISIDSIIELHNRQIMDFAISSDEKQIAYVYGNLDNPHNCYSNDIMDREIRLFDIISSKNSILVSKGIDAHSPAWSNDNKKIAFFALNNNRMQIFVYDLEKITFSCVTDMEYSCPNAFDGCFSNARLFWTKDDKYLATSFLQEGSMYYLKYILPILKSENEIFYESNLKLENLNGYTDQYKQSILIINTETNEVSILKTSQNKFMMYGFMDNNSIIYGEYGKLFSHDIITDKMHPLNLCDRQAIKISNGDILYAGVNNNRLFWGKNDIEIATTEYNADLIKAFDVSSNETFAIYAIYEKMSVKLLKLFFDGEFIILSNDNDCIYDSGVQAAPRILPNDEIIYILSNEKTLHEFYMVDDKNNNKQISNFNRFIENSGVTINVLPYFSDGYKIETTILLPPGYDKSKRYPALIYLHGGPNIFENMTFSNLISARGQSAAISLCQEGFIVALPNYRGTLGYGKNHIEKVPHNAMEFIETPFADVAACKMFLIENYCVDEKHIGIYGSSYGAHITGWSITHSNVFYAAACVIGIEYDVEFINKQASKSEDFWVKKDSKFSELSIINYISNISCPILIIETGQAEGKKYSGKVFYNALCAYKKNAERVLYPDAFHNGGWTDEYKSDYIKRLIEFFKFHLNE